MFRDWLLAFSSSILLGAFLAAIVISPIAYGAFEYMVAVPIGMLIGAFMHPLPLAAASSRPLPFILLVISFYSVSAAFITKNQQYLGLPLAITISGFLVGCGVARLFVPKGYPRGNCQICGYIIDREWLRCPECGGSTRADSSQRYTKSFIILSGIFSIWLVVLIVLWSNFGPQF